MDKQQKKPRGGRSKKDLEEKLSERYVLYVNKKDAKWIEKHAKYYHSTSDFLYRCIKDTELILPDNSTVKLLREMGELKNLLKDNLSDKANYSIEDFKDKITHILNDIEITNQGKLKKDMLFEIHKIGNNINQVAKKVNTYKESVDTARIILELEDIKKALSKIEKITQINESDSN